MTWHKKKSNWSINSIHPWKVHGCHLSYQMKSKWETSSWTNEQKTLKWDSYREFKTFGHFLYKGHLYWFWYPLNQYQLKNRFGSLFRTSYLSSRSEYCQKKVQVAKRPFSKVSRLKQAIQFQSSVNRLNIFRFMMLRILLNKNKKKSHQLWIFSKKNLRITEL